jgi:DNA-binding NarL/FixJ family response regulator
MTLPRVLVVDDSPGFLAAAARVLRGEGMVVVGTAATSAEALSRTREMEPDVALVDIDLGPESGLELARRLAAEPDARRRRIILISTHSAEDFADLIAASPAIGFLPKSRLSATAIEQLLERDGADDGG